MGSACSTTTDNMQQQNGERITIPTPRAPTVHSEEERTATGGGGTPTTPTIVSTKTHQDDVPPVVVDEGGGECSPTISQQHITPTTSSQCTQRFTAQHQPAMTNSTGSGYVSISLSNHTNSPQRHLSAGMLGDIGGDPLQPHVSPDPTVVPAQSSGDHSESSPKSSTQATTPERKLRRRRNQQYPRTQLGGNGRTGTNTINSKATSLTRRSAPHNSPTQNSSHLNIPSHHNPTHHGNDNDYDKGGFGDAPSPHEQPSSHQMIVAFLRRIIGNESTPPTSLSSHHDHPETDEILRNSLPSFSDAQQLAEVIIQVSAYERDVREEREKNLSPNNNNKDVAKSPPSSSSNGNRPIVVDLSSARHQKCSETPSNHHHPNAVQDKSWSPTFLAANSADDNDPSSLSLSTCSDNDNNNVAQLSSSYDGSLFRGDGAELGIVASGQSCSSAGSQQSHHHRKVFHIGHHSSTGTLLVGTSEDVSGSEEAVGAAALATHHSAGVIIPISPTHKHLPPSKASSSHLGGTYNSTVTMESAASSANPPPRKNDPKHRRHRRTSRRGGGSRHHHITNSSSIPISKCDISVLETTAAAAALVARDRHQRRQSAALHASMASSCGIPPHMAMKRASTNYTSTAPDGNGSFFASQVSEGGVDGDRQTPTNMNHPPRGDSTTTLTPAAPLSYYTSQSSANKTTGDAMIDFGTGAAISPGTSHTAQSSTSDRKAGCWDKDSPSLTTSSRQAASSSTHHYPHTTILSGVGQQLEGSHQIGGGGSISLPSLANDPHINNNGMYSPSRAMSPGSPSIGSPQSLQLLASNVAFLDTKPFVNLESMGELGTTSPPGEDAKKSAPARISNTNNGNQMPSPTIINSPGSPPRGPATTTVGGASLSATLIANFSRDTGRPSLDSSESGPRLREETHTGACQQSGSLIAQQSSPEIIPSTSSSSLLRKRPLGDDIVTKMKGDADDHVDVDVDTGGVCGAANQLAGSTATTVTPLNDGSSSMGTGELTVFRSNCGYMNNKKQQHQNNDALADVPSSVGGVVISTLTTTTTTVTTTIQAHPQHDHSHHHRTNDTNDDDTGEYDNYTDTIVVLEVLRKLLRGNMGIVSTPLDFHDAIKSSFDSQYLSSAATEDTPDPAQQLPSFVAMATQQHHQQHPQQHQYHNQLYPPRTTNIHVHNAGHGCTTTTNANSLLDRTIPSMISSSGSSSDPASIRQQFAATLQGRSSTLPIASIPADSGGDESDSAASVSPPAHHVAPSPPSLGGNTNNTNKDHSYSHSTTSILKGSSSAMYRVTSGEEFGSTIRSMPGGVSIGPMSPLGSFSHHLRANRGPHICSATGSLHSCTQIPPLLSSTNGIASKASAHHLLATYTPVGSTVYLTRQAPSPTNNSNANLSKIVVPTRAPSSLIPGVVERSKLSNPIHGSDDSSPQSHNSDPSAIESYASLFTSPSSPIPHSQHSSVAAYSSMVMYPSAQLSAPLLVSQSSSSCGGGGGTGKSGPLDHGDDPHHPHYHGGGGGYHPSQMEGSMLSVQWSSIAKMEVRQRLLFNDSILSDTKDTDAGGGCVPNGGGTRHLVLVERPGKMKTDPASKMCVVLPRVFMDVEVYAAIPSSSSSNNNPPPAGGTTSSGAKNHHSQQPPPPPSSTTTTTTPQTTTTTTHALSSPSAVCTFARGGGIDRIAVNSLTREERRVLHSYIRKALRCLRPAALKIVCSLVVDSIGVIRALHEAVLAEQQATTATARPSLVPEFLSAAAGRKNAASTTSDSPSPPTSPQQLGGIYGGTQQTPSPPQVPRPPLSFYISMTGRRVPLPPGVTAADVLQQQHHIRAGNSPRTSIGGGGGARVGAGYAPGKGGYRRSSRDRSGNGFIGGDMSPSYGSAAHSFFGNESLNNGIMKARVGSRGKGGHHQSTSSRHTPASSLIYSPSSRSDNAHQLQLSVAGNGDADASVIIDDGVDWLTSAQFGGQQIVTPRGRSTHSVSPSNSLHTSTNRSNAAAAAKHHHRLPAPPSRTPSPMSRNITNTTITGGGGRVHRPFAHDSSATESNSTSLSGSSNPWGTTARGVGIAAAHNSSGYAGSSGTGRQAFGSPLTTVVTTSTSLSSYGNGGGGAGGGVAGDTLLASGSESTTPSGSSVEHTFTTTTATTPSASLAPLRVINTTTVNNNGGASHQPLATSLSTPLSGSSSNVIKYTRSVLGNSNSSDASGNLHMSGLQNVMGEGAFSSSGSSRHNQQHHHHPHMPHTSSTAGASSTIHRGTRAGSISSGLLVPTTPDVRGGLPGGPPAHRVPDARLMVIEGVDIANVMSPDSRSMHVTPMATPLDMNSQYNANNTGRHLFTNNSTATNTTTTHNDNTTSNDQHGYMNPLAGRSTSNSLSSHPSSHGVEQHPPHHRRRPEDASPRGGRMGRGSVDSGDGDEPMLTSIPSNVSSSVRHTHSLLDNFSAAMVLKSAPSNSSLRTSSVRLPASSNSRVGSQAHLLGGDEKDRYLSPKSSGVRLLARRPQTQDSGSRSRLQRSNNSSTSPQRGDSQRSMSLVQPLSATSDAGEKQLLGGGGAPASPAHFPAIPLQSSSSARVSGGSSKRLI